jgi:hypothetical protein
MTVTQMRPECAIIHPVFFKADTSDEAWIVCEVEAIIRPSGDGWLWIVFSNESKPGLYIISVNDPLFGGFSNG